MGCQKQEKMYKALANQRRLRILFYLNKQKQATVGEIAHHINLSFKATSKHLQILKSAGMVGNRQVGLQQYYHIIRSNKYIKQALTNL